ncbi:MAG: tetratricopeptide repeat protein [bacterium]
MSIKLFRKINLYYVLILLVILLINCLQRREMNYLAHIAQGDKLRNKGEYQKAKIQYEKAIKINPYSKDAYRHLGTLYQYQLENNKKAIEIFLKGLEYAPDDFGLNLNLMYAYMNQGELDNALYRYKKLAEIRSENQKYSFPKQALEKLFRDMKESEIINFCHKYLLINPTDLRLHETLASIYKRSLDYENWEKQVKAVLKYHYTEQAKKGYYFDLASIYAHYEQYQKALKYFELSKQAGFPVPQEIFDDLDQKIQEKNK